MNRVYELTCVCGEAFTAKSPRAVWHSPACRTRHKRAGVEQAEPESTTPDPSIESHSLVRTTLAELTKAGVVETFAGQLALQLARRLASPDESGVSALSRELRTVMAAALEGLVPPAPTEPEQPELDELEKARAARERKARAAARRT